MLKASSLFPQIKATASFKYDFNKEIVTLFYEVLADYCHRFKLEVPTKERQVIINGRYFDLGEPVQNEGLSLTDTEKDVPIYIEVGDPMLEHGPELPAIVITRFTEVLCHEFVHACQDLTGRKGVQHKIKFNKKNVDEKYYFDPYEVEARILEGFYRFTYGHKLITKWQKSLTSKQTGSGPK